MTKQTMIRNYRKFSAADSYIIGYNYKGTIFATEIDEIPPRFMKVERESSKKGGKQKLQLRLNNKYKEQLMKKGAVEVCGADELTDEVLKNKGVVFEKKIYELNGQIFRGKDNVGFWVAGDIELNGKQIQIKLEGAQIVVENTLKNLQKSA